MGMVQRRRRRDLSTLDGLVRAGRLQVVNPTTDTGWRSYGAGGRLFLPAATNYCTNPVAAVDTVGWTVNGAGSSASRQVGVTPLGDTFMRLVRGSTNSELRGPYVVSAAGEVWTISAWVRGTPGVPASLALVNWYSGTGNAAVNFTLTDTWVRVSATGPAVVDDGHPNRTMFVRFTGGTAGDVLEVVGMQAEKSPFPTPYFDGSTANCAWTGTPNASTSTRAVSVLAYPPLGDIMPMQGTIAGRMTHLGPVSAGSQHCSLAGFYGSSPFGNVRAYLTQSAGRPRMWVSGESTSVTSPDAGVPYSVVGRWTEANVQLNHDGVDQPQSVNPVVGLATSNIAVGQAPLGGYVCPVLISPTRKSDAWVTAIQANSGAAYNDPVRLYREFMSPGDMLIPLQGDSRAYKKV